MRIALISHQWPGVRLGGIGVYTVNAARMFAAAGHEAAHLQGSAFPEEARAGALHANVVVHEVPDSCCSARFRAISWASCMTAAVHAGGQAVYRLALAALPLRRSPPRPRPQAVRYPRNRPEYEALGLPLLLSPIPNLLLVTHIHSGSAVVRLATGSEATGEQATDRVLEAAALLAADGLCAPTRQVIADTRKGCPIGDVQVLALPYFSAMEVPYTDPPLCRSTRRFFSSAASKRSKRAHLLPAALNQFLEQHPAGAHPPRRSGHRHRPPRRAPAPWPTGFVPNSAPSFCPASHSSANKPTPSSPSNCKPAAFVIVPSLAESYSYVLLRSDVRRPGPSSSATASAAADVVGDAGLTFRLLA